MLIARVIREAVEGAGVTFRELALQLDVDPATPTRWASGTRAVSSVDIERIAEALGRRLVVLMPDPAGDALVKVPARLTDEQRALVEGFAAALPSMSPRELSLVQTLVAGAGEIEKGVDRDRPPVKNHG